MNRAQQRRKASNILIITHGKSEYDIFTFIQQASGKSIYVFADHQGHQFKSIQITSLLLKLNKAPFNKIKHFKNRFDNIEYNGDELPNDFNVFIIMDTDDCTVKQKENFLNKEMFKGHWLYNYINPIHNSENLEDVLLHAKINYPKSKRSNYGEIFRSKRTQPKLEAIIEINELLKRYPIRTNMHLAIEACIK